MKRIVVVVLAAWSMGSGAGSHAAQPASDGDRVVLVTLDGARGEEVFGGIDRSILESTLKPPQRVEDDAVYKRFWAESREERRRKLMPFFWSLVSEHGSIAGDRASGSIVQLRNRHGFSYPGYAEILLGEPHDDEIRSNAPLRNPYPTVLERVRERLRLTPAEVATFASWGVFNEIAEHTPGATLVNAGVRPLGGSSAEVRLLDRLQAQALPTWEITRFDVFTFRLAMAHLAAAKPRVLYVAFTETDDWAHDGRYDRVLDAYAHIDGYLRELWNWLENDPAYRGRTHLIVTTDHGRGHSVADWRVHRADVPGSEEAWLAFASPRMPKRGVWHDSTPLSSSQIAATIASWLGVDWNGDHPRAGLPIR
jgi:hypothetical protein